MPLHADGELAALDGVNALIWTTTPWTLPSNLAIAVHPDVEYSHVRTENGEEYLLATALLGSYTAELGEVETLGTYAGKRLAGCRTASLRLLCRPYELARGVVGRL